MPIADSLLPEFDHETATTRVLLERVPNDKAAFKPHVRSRSLGELAIHMAHLPQWSSIALERREFDTNPPDGSRAPVPAYESAAGMLQLYDANVRAARDLLARTSDGEFMVAWTLKSGGKVMFNMPRVVVFRIFVLNHAIHHRGQLSVYLRLLDVPVPNIYGPTADSEP